MPQRSNDFQRAIFAVQKHMAPDSRVEESEELIDLVSGEPREVDVVIHGEVGGHQVVVGMECRDHKRRQPVGFIEEMKTKHDRLPTDSLILVSSTGFTEGARDKAASFNIHLVSPGQDLAALGLEVKKQLETMWFKAVTARPDGLAALIYRGDDAEPVLARLHEDTNLYGASGEVRATAKEFCVAVMERPGIFQEVLRDATGEEKRFSMVVELEDEEDQLYVLADDVDPNVLMRVLKFEVMGPTHIEVMPYELRHGALAGVPFAFGGGTSEHFQVSFSVADPDFEDPDKSGSRTLHVRRTKMPEGLGDEGEAGPANVPGP